jgi:hypothetical protein
VDIDYQADPPSAWAAAFWAFPELVTAPHTAGEPQSGKRECARSIDSAPKIAKRRVGCSTFPRPAACFPRRLFPIVQEGVPNLLSSSEPPL